MAGRGLMTLPRYAVIPATSSNQLQRWLASCSVITDCGIALTVSGLPQCTKKLAEQAAAAAMLQQPELQQKVACLQAASDMVVKPAMQLLHELVAHNSWAMEQMELVNISRAASADREAVWQARVVINGHLLGVGSSRDRVQATHKAAEVALAVLGIVPVPASSMLHPAAALQPASAAPPVVAAAGYPVQPAPVQPALFLQETTDSKPALCADKIQRQSLDFHKQLSTEAVRNGLFSPYAGHKTQ